MELLHNKPKEINGLFGVQKEVDEKRPIQDTRKTNCHFIEQKYPVFTHLAQFMLHEKSVREKKYVEKLDADNVYHHLRLPEHVLMFSGFPSFLSEKTMRGGSRA